MSKTKNWIMLPAFCMATTPICALAAATPLEPGTISIETSFIRPAQGYSVDAFSTALGDALASRNYTVLEGHGHARMVAELLLTQTEIGTANTRVALAGKPLFAGRGVAGVGGNITVPLQSGKTKLVPILQTRLEIRIKKLGADAVLWSGNALTVRPSNAENGQEKVVATDLVQAIFRAYPAQPEGVIAVP